MRGPGRIDGWLRAKETGRVEDVKRFSKFRLVCDV